MNSNFCNLRPFSQINIQNNSSYQSHQCPHCKCSPPKYYHQTHPSPRPSININYASPSKNMTKIQPPLLYSPLISKPINVENNCYKKVSAYNQNNIYYNRPTQVNISKGSSSSSSQQKFHLLKPQIRTTSPHQILVRQPHPVLFSRPTSPPIMRTDINNRSIVRFISPPPVICHVKDVNVQNNTSTGEIQEILASKSSAFTFGQPRKPEILRMKKPGIKRLSSLNSQNSQNSSNGQIKSPIKEQIQSKNRMTNTYNYNKNTLQRCQISPKIERPIQLKQKLSEKYLSLLNKPKRYYSSSQGQTTTSNNTQMLSHTQTEYMTMDQVNTTYMKSTEHTNHLNHEVLNENREEMEIENKNSHLYEQEHKIAEILVEELKLNYDYFNKNQITDRSISDHVQI